MEDVLPSRGIKNATPDISFGRDPLEFIRAAACTHRLGLVISSKGNETVLNFQTAGILYSWAHLRVRYLRGFLGQAAALCRNQVVVLGADVLV